MSTNTQAQLQAAPQCPYWRLETAGGTLFASLLGMRRGQIWREAVGRAYFCSEAIFWVARPRWTEIPRDHVP